MKVAIYCHSISPSIDGVCRRFTAIMKELVRQGHTVVLFTLETEPEDLPMLSEVITLPHMCFPAYPGKKVARPNAQSMFKIWCGLARHQPDVVHITCDGISQMFSLSGMLLGIPVVGSFHTDIIDLISTHNANSFQKACVIFKESLDSYVLDSCATTSASFQEKLKKQYVSTDHVLKTAVDINVFSPKKRNLKLRNELTFGNPNAFLCVYVGRISKEKRIEIIHEACSSLDNVYLALIGDGPTASVWSKLHAKENRLYCVPKFKTHEELAEIYASADLHVSASEFETLGNTVLEAFASNIPVVVPYTQGFRDTVTTKDTTFSSTSLLSTIVESKTKTQYHDGYLFIPGDANSARGYIKLLQEDPMLTKKLGDNGRKNVVNSTPEQVVLDMLQWYECGMQKRKERDSNILRIWMYIFPLIISIPITIIALFFYDLVTMFMVNILGLRLDLGADHNHDQNKNDKHK